MPLAETVIFDLDGTLVDSLPDIAAAANAALSQFDKPPQSHDTVRGFIGNGLPRLAELVQKKAGLDPSDEFLTALLDYYGEHPCDGTIPYPGVVTALKDLHHCGMALAVCSNKTQALCDKVIAGLGWSRYFDLVIGGDTLPTRKPSPEPLLYCVEQLGRTPALYIGDSEVDEATARAAKLPFGFFTEGYAHAEITSERFRFSNFASLPEQLDRLDL